MNITVLLSGYRVVKKRMNYIAEIESLNMTFFQLFLIKLYIFLVTEIRF